MQKAGLPTTRLISDLVGNPKDRLSSGVTRFHYVVSHWLGSNPKSSKQLTINDKKSLETEMKIAICIIVTDNHLKRIKTVEKALFSANCSCF